MTQHPEFKIRASDADLKGVYSNSMRVTHTQEEFVLDFLNIVPADNTGVLVARIVTSPEHFKRIVSALKENLQKYEDRFGEIKSTQEPKETNTIGFKVS